MLNNKPCGSCRYFDVIKAANKPTKAGWCAQFSIYPYREGPGQTFPDGVKRASSPEDLAKPYIVQVTDIIQSCAKFEAK